MPSSTDGHVHDALEERGGLRATGTAVGSRRRRVGGRADGVELDLRDLVDALGHHAGQERQEAADRRDTHRRRTRPWCGPPRSCPSRVRPMSTYWTCPRPWLQGNHVLGSGLGPLHRATEPLRERDRDRRTRRTIPFLAPKPPPTAGATTRTCSGSSPSAPHSGVADAVRGLRRAPSAMSVVVGARLDEDAVGLHRHRGDALVHEAARHHHVGAVEDLGIVAEVELDREVRAVLGEQERRTVRERGLGVDDDGQRVVVDDAPSRPRRPPAPASRRRPPRRRRRRSGRRRRRSGGRLNAGGIMTNPCTGSSARVSCVCTARTPGMASASAVSIPVTRAWAIVDRTKTTCTVPSGAMSSKYLASPRRMRGSSRRWTGLPRIEPPAVGAVAVMARDTSGTANRTDR